MSWGIKIACLYTGFGLFIAIMVSLTMGENTDLVTPDYYEQELKFQDRIDAINRTGLLKEQLTWELKENKLYLRFPQELQGRKMRGTIYFFRPSDAKLDKKAVIPDIREGMSSIPVKMLKKGMYKIQINWQADSTIYFNEGVIQIH